MLVVTFGRLDTRHRGGSGKSLTVCETGGSHDIFTDFVKLYCFKLPSKC